MAASGTIQGFDSIGRGIQYSKNEMSVSITDFPSDVVIKKITLDVSANDKGADASVKVDGTNFGTTQSIPSANHTMLEFTGSTSGSTISISATPGDKSTYILSVKVEWEKPVTKEIT